MGMGASNFLSVEGNLDFLGGLLAKETLSGFGIFGTSLIKLHVDIFGGAVDAWGRFLFPPFLFLPASWPNCDLWTRELLLIKPTGRERTGLWTLPVQTAKYPCPMLRQFFLNSSFTGLFYYYGAEMVLLSKKNCVCT